MDNMSDARLDLIYELLHQKAATSRVYTQYIDSDREYGAGDKLYMREAHFVMAIGPGEGKTMSDIAQKLDVTQGAVSQTAARLEKKGYIQRQKCPSNRRQTIAMLTPKGEAFYDAHQKYDRELYAYTDKMCFSRYSDEALRMLSDYEAAVMQMMQVKFEAGNATAPSEENAI